MKLFSLSKIIFTFREVQVSVFILKNVSGEQIIRDKLDCQVTDIVKATTYTFFRFYEYSFDEVKCDDSAM